MFEVTAVRPGLLSKLVELTVIEETAGVTRVVGAGLRSFRVYECPYNFPSGVKLILEYPRRKRFEIGDRIDVATVLRHPSVEEMIFRRASKNGWEPAK